MKRLKNEEDFAKTHDTANIGELGQAGLRLACNEDLAARTRDFLAQHSEASFDNRVEAAIAMHSETSMRNQIDSARMPTKVRGQFVARLQNELAEDLIGQQFCAMDTMNWGESYQYSTLTRKAVPIYKLSEPGGKPKSIGWSNTEGVVDLGLPIIYTTEEFAIQKFNRSAPDKWLRELDRAVAWAKRDLQVSIDTDIWTTLDAQIGGGLNQVGFTYQESRVKNTPSSNNLVASSLSEGLNKDALQEILLHGSLTNRRLVKVAVPTLGMKTVWNWVNNDTYAPRISQALMAEIERTGGAAMNLWGYNIVFQPTNILEGSTAPCYAYASFESIDPLSVPGAAFYVVGQAQNEADYYDCLEFVRRDGMYDVFVAHAEVLICSIDLQMPNIAKIRYK